MKKLMIAALAMAAFGATDVAAQSVNGNATVNIPQVLSIANATDLAIAEDAFDLVSNATQTVTASTTVDTRGNVPHSVEVTGGALTLAGSNDLALEVQNAGGTWAAVGATAVTVLDATTLTRGVHAAQPINFRTEADISKHGPGAYTGTITYTVVAN
ncbi:MAG: hypothetical protein R6U63_09285 [Longimicrobiales bacterium]